MLTCEQPAREAVSLEDAFDIVTAALRSGDGKGLRNGQLQSLFADVVRAYARLREENRHLAAFPKETDVSATEVAIAATGILDAADMAVFELGMWQTLKN